MSHHVDTLRLRIAVENLEHDATADDLSKAIDAFGQVIADLTDMPCMLAVLTGEAFEIFNAQLSEIEALKGEIRLLHFDGGTVQ